MPGCQRTINRATTLAFGLRMQTRLPPKPPLQTTHSEGGQQKCPTPTRAAQKTRPRIHALPACPSSPNFANEYAEEDRLAGSRAVRQIPRSGPLAMPAPRRLPGSALRRVTRSEAKDNVSGGLAWFAEVQRGSKHKRNLKGQAVP